MGEARSIELGFKSEAEEDDESKGITWDMTVSSECCEGKPGRERERERSFFYFSSGAVNRMHESDTHKLD